MTTYLSNRDGNGLTNEEGHYRFQTKVWSGNVLSGLNVSQNGTANMTVLVAPGDIKIDYSSYAYTAWNDANASVTIATADTSNPRIDRIIAYIDRSMTWSGQSNNPGGLKFIAVAGSPAAAPVKATNSVVNAAVNNNPWCELATVSVAANITQITGVNITDTRTMVTLMQNSVGVSQILSNSINNSKVQDNTLSRQKIDWSTFANNIKSASNSTSTGLGNGNTNLAAQGASLTFTVSSACVAFVTVNTAVFSGTDFEHKPLIYLDGNLVAGADYPASTTASARTQPRSYSAKISIPAGSHVVSAGVSLAASTGASVYVGGANLSAIVFGDVIA